VPAHLVELCRVPNIGKVRANRLFAKGIKTIDDLAGMSLENFKSVANIKGEMAEQILKDARKISFN
jgi:predicted RecB family nuclease